MARHCVARILLSVMFIYSDFGKITGFEGTARLYRQQGIADAAIDGDRRYPRSNWAPACCCSSATKALGGVWPSSCSWIPTTIVFHNFWLPRLAEYQTQLINFLKNVTIMGGMLMVWAFGPGRLALDRDAG